MTAGSSSDTNQASALLSNGGINGTDWCQGGAHTHTCAFEIVAAVRRGNSKRQLVGTGASDTSGHHSLSFHRQLQPVPCTPGLLPILT